VGTIPFLVALGLALLGAVLLAVGARGPWLAALGGGAMLGVAGAILLLGGRMLPLGSQTPLVVVLLGLGVGLSVGLAGWWRRRQP
jgi:hypothetical protein